MRQINTKFIQIVYLVSMILLYLIYSVDFIWAHGGGTPQWVNEDIGPYWISSWIQPFPPQTDDFHLTLALSEPTDPQAQLREAGPPVLNAQIEVTLRWQDQTDIIVSAIASHENTVNRLMYEADFVLPRPGQWIGTVMVTGPDGQVGTRDFVVEVVEESVFNIRWLITIGVVIFFAVTFIMMARSQSPST